jgi:hypothetical protein
MVYFSVQLMRALKLIDDKIVFIWEWILVDEAEI